jgi:hypothetical protein
MRFVAVERPFSRIIGNELDGTIDPTGTSMVASGHCALSGTQPPSVQLTAK